MAGPMGEECLILQRLDTPGWEIMEGCPCRGKEEVGWKRVEELRERGQEESSICDVNK